MRFEGTSCCVATEDLRVAVNAPLGLPLIAWHIKPTTKAQHGVYPVPP